MSAWLDEQIWAGDDSINITGVTIKITQDAFKNMGLNSRQNINPPSTALMLSSCCSATRSNWVLVFLAIAVFRFLLSFLPPHLLFLELRNWYYYPSSSFSSPFSSCDVRDTNQWIVTLYFSSTGTCAEKVKRLLETKPTALATPTFTPCWIHYGTVQCTVEAREETHKNPSASHSSYNSMLDLLYVYVMY